MRIEYKFCPNLTIIDTPGERAVLNARKARVLLLCSVQAGTSLLRCLKPRLTHCWVCRRRRPHLCGPRQAQLIAAEQRQAGAVQALALTGACGAQLPSSLMEACAWRVNSCSVNRCWPRLVLPRPAGGGHGAHEDGAEGVHHSVPGGLQRLEQRHHAPPGHAGACRGVHRLRVAAEGWRDAGCRGCANPTCKCLPAQSCWCSIAALTLAARVLFCAGGPHAVAHCGGLHQAGHAHPAGGLLVPAA